MKNYSFKIAIIATSFAMAYFASGIASIAQASELLKAEPVKYANLITQAQNNLVLSFSTIAITPSSAKVNAKNMMAKKVVTSNKNRTITESKITLISE